MEEQGFHNIVGQLLLFSILTRSKRTLETIMESNASNQGIASILSQCQVVKGCKQLNWVVYYVKQLSAPQHNRAIHTDQLFGIVDWFQKLKD